MSNGEAIPMKSKKALCLNLGLMALYLVLMALNSGPYRLVRHPRYLALIIAQTAFALIFASPLAWGFLVLWIFLMLRRIRLEERHLQTSLVMTTRLTLPVPQHSFPACCSSVRASCCPGHAAVLECAP